MAEKRETPAKQIDRLAEFIMAEVPGEPSESEGAVDCAIRIIGAGPTPTAPSAGETAIVKAMQTVNRTLAKSNKIQERMADAYEQYLQADEPQAEQTYASIGDAPVEPADSTPDECPDPEGPETLHAGDLTRPLQEDPPPTPEAAKGPGVTKAMVTDAVRAALTGGRREQVTSALTSIGADNLSGVPEDRYEWLVAQVAE